MQLHENDLETIPVGSLGLITLKGCEALGAKINDYIVDWRNERENEHKTTIAFSGYQRDNYIVKTSVPRFGSGEAKGVINESVRGYDLYLLVDVCNYSLTYSLCGEINHMSPDDHYQDLKRIIAALGGKARRISVIMPFLYESRQHKRSGRESLDCALALRELIGMGVDNIITFDAHDPRVQNAIPLSGFETVHASDRRYRDQAGNRLTDFISIKVRGPLAERCAAFAWKGCKLAAVGDFETITFEDDPTRQPGFLIKATEVEFLSPRKAEGEAETMDQPDVCEAA